MGLSEAKSALQWNAVFEALAAAGIDTDTVELVKKFRSLSVIVESAASLLQGSTDTAHAKNYIKVELVGMLPPFDRAYVELIRPGGKSSHALRELLRNRLVHVHTLLSEGTPLPALREGIMLGIAEDLAAESSGE